YYKKAADQGHVGAMCHLILIETKEIFEESQNLFLGPEKTKTIARLIKKAHKTDINEVENFFKEWSNVHQDVDFIHTLTKFFLQVAEQSAKNGELVLSLDLYTTLYR